MLLFTGSENSRSFTMYGFTSEEIIIRIWYMCLSLMSNHPHMEMGSMLKVLSETMEKLGIDPGTPALQTCSWQADYLLHHGGSYNILMIFI